MQRCIIELVDYILLLVSDKEKSSSREEKKSTASYCRYDAKSVKPAKKTARKKEEKDNKGKDDKKSK